MDRDLQELHARWWILTIRGIITVLFGIAAVFWPGLTTVTLIYLFGAWVLVDGVVRMIGGITSLGKHQLGFLTIVVGLLELGVGVYLLRHPGVAAGTLLLLISFMLIIAGVVGIVAALSARSEGATAKTLEIIVGASAVLAGIILLFQPAAALGYVWILGLYALIAGPMMIAMSIELKNLTLPATPGAILTSADKRTR